MHRDYKNENMILGIDKQHNIMIFIGNGFDISILQKYRKDKLVSSYSKFYDFLCYKEFNKDNLLFKKMSEDKTNGKENWSDFEESLNELLCASISSEDLNCALKEIQNMFLLFLNELVTPEILLKLNDDVLNHKWSINALAKFLGDLDREDFERMNFPSTTDHYHMYNYLFVNFNYTSLFDNYIQLDRYRFEPHPHKHVDTNFTFTPNPNGYLTTGSNERTLWSSFIMTDIIHPHGYQSIPRSLLFGIENVLSDNRCKQTNFNKSYWAQCNPKYKTYFSNTELFIIYGMSIGRSDSWWWNNIYDALQGGHSELIIYFFDKDNCYSKDYVKEKFLKVCNKDLDAESIAQIKEKIYVVLYNDQRKCEMFNLDTD